MNLIRFLIMMPWYGYLILGAGVAALGFYSDGSAQQRAEALRAAMATQAPGEEFLNDYSRPDGKFTEGTLIVQIVMDDIVRLVDRTNGIKTGEDLMVPLADPRAEIAPSQYRALMILSERQADMFDDWAIDNLIGEGPLGPILSFSGIVTGSDGEASHASDALADFGKSTVSNEIYVEPYFQPRSEVLATKLRQAENSRGNFNAITA
ncbi:MAG: hypothetical protein AAFN59_14000, partial [Pseudomonadota bacterium]